MNSIHSQRKCNSGRLLSWLLIGSFSAMLFSGCSEKSRLPERDTKQSGKTEQASEGATKPQEEKQEEKGADKLLILSTEEIQRAGIRVQQLDLQEQAEQVVVTATIQANQDRLAHVAPRISGRIVKVMANLGDKVKSGQPLAVLDSIELGEARSAFLQAASEAAVAQAGFERAKRLQADNIIPEKEFLRARAEQEKAQASLRAASDKLRMIGINPENPSGSTFPVFAPFSGTVIEKKAVLGDLAPPDQSLFTVADLSVLWIEANLYDKDLSKVSPGAQASVTVSAYPNEVFKGRLTYISSVMDKDSRTVKARIEVPNSNGMLKLDMFATAAIHTGTGTGVKVLAVPEEAVLLLQGMPTVFVAKKDGFEQRTVEVGERAQGYVVLKSGVEAGENVVISGAYDLKARLLKAQIGDSD